MLHKAVVQIPNVGNRHVAGAAAALYIVKGSLAQKRNMASLWQGEKVFFILEKHHSFLCSLLGEPDVLSGSGDPGFSVQRKPGQILCSCPFLHVIPLLDKSCWVPPTDTRSQCSPFLSQANLHRRFGSWAPGIIVFPLLPESGTRFPSPGTAPCESDPPP